jgi:hypothetical protein
MLGRLGGGVPWGTGVARRAVASARGIEALYDRGWNGDVPSICGDEGMWMPAAFGESLDGEVMLGERGYREDVEMSCRWFQREYKRLMKGRKPTKPYLSKTSPQSSFQPHTSACCCLNALEEIRRRRQCQCCWKVDRLQAPRKPKGCHLLTETRLRPIYAGDKINWTAQKTMGFCGVVPVIARDKKEGLDLLTNTTYPIEADARST